MSKRALELSYVSNTEERGVFLPMLRTSKEKRKRVKENDAQVYVVVNCAENLNLTQIPSGVLSHSQVECRPSPAEARFQNTSRSKKPRSDASNTLRKKKKDTYTRRGPFAITFEKKQQQPFQSRSQTPRKVNKKKKKIRRRRFNHVEIFININTHVP